MFMASSSSESEVRCSCRCLQTSDCRSASYPLLSHGPTLEIFLRAAPFLPESFRNYLLLFRVSNLHLLQFSLFKLLRWMMHVCLFMIGKGKRLRDACIKCNFFSFYLKGWGTPHENFAFWWLLERRAFQTINVSNNVLLQSIDLRIDFWLLNV